MDGEKIITGLTPLQADGLACVTCGADYLRVRVPHVPVGRSVTDSQVFACVGCCSEASRRAAGGVLRWRQVGRTIDCGKAERRLPELAGAAGLSR